MNSSSDIPSEVAQQLADCESRIEYEFNDKQLLLSALTHASGAQHRLASNERLEFLGDAILGAVICERLFHQFPDLLEGNLTKIKSSVVSRITCAKVSERLGLAPCLIVGKGMANGTSVPRSLLSDMFESLVAALYLDGGIDVATRFIHRTMDEEIELAASGDVDENYKSLLQQIVQRDFASTPTYLLVEEKGPDHNKCFCVAARFNNQAFPPAWGQNKKQAEQRAACNALAALNGEDAPFSDEE